jgi:putative DNA primase/helicase
MPEYFKDGVTLNLHSKDDIMQATSKALVELGELAATFSKSDNDDIKAFLSNKHDEFREPYDRRSEIYKRRTVFCATVNDSIFLRDTTGSRRFFVIKINTIDINRIQNIPMQLLWGQVYNKFLAKEPYRLLPKEKKMLEERNLRSTVVTPAIEAYNQIIQNQSNNIKLQRLRPKGIFEALNMSATKNDLNELANLLDKFPLNSKGYLVPIE